ncbi:MAG: hypothetical protein EP338_07655 [Bacteroidetes bacterium]|nr:MAG: hypothetical protein EP338_07655 [Bacteroidota bacterium]
MKRCIYILCLCLSTVFSVAQNTSTYGKFYNQFYSIDDFGSAAQIWTGTAGSDGNIYFGNDDEILSFNGKTWSKVKTWTEKGKKDSVAVTKTKVCKLFTARDGVTYVGRYNNFGRLTYNRKGQVVYEPLFYTDEENAFGKVWNIFEDQEGAIHFIGGKKVFRYQKGIISTLDPGKEFEKHVCLTSGFLGKGALLTFWPEDIQSENSQERKYVYYDFEASSFQIIKRPGTAPPNIRGTANINGSWHVFCGNGAVYKLRIEGSKLKWLDSPSRFDKVLQGNTINAVKLHGKHIFVATEYNGIFILNLGGDLVRIINLEDDLASNSVFDLFLDNENNLWANLDTGIHFFETSSPLTYFDKNDGISERTERFDFANGIEYIGNNIDIFGSYVQDNHKKFKSLEILNESVFDLRTYQTSFGPKTLIVGYNGIYEVDYVSKKRERIAEEYAWRTFQNPDNKDEFYVGLEESLGLLKIGKEGWTYETIIPEVNGNIISLAFHQGKVIFGAENRGVFVYDPKTKKHDLIQVKGRGKIRSPYYVQTFKNRVYAGLEGGIYYLSEDMKSLVPWKILNSKFYAGNSGFQIHRILNDNDKRLWIVTHSEADNSFEQGWLELKKTNVLDPSKEKWSWTSWPFALITIQKDGLAYDIQKGYGDDIWLSTNKHIYLFNPNSLKSFKKSFRVSIDEIKVNNKTMVYNPFFADKIGDLEYEKNTLKFIFQANSFMGKDHMKYRFRLKGDSEWSEWSELNFAEFQKLFEGSYTFEVQAKNCYGFLSSVQSYKFKILAPWYRTWWAYTIYTIVFFVLIYLIIQLSIQRVKNQNIRLEGIVKERTSEIAAQNKLLEVQKEEITQKTRDILDSIVYAKRIQETILPTDRLPQIFEEHFVFYRPKDIVSGDFYWARQKGSKAIFSAIDCTGHGVPGALVSIVGNAALLRCVNEHRLTEPAELLDKLREIVTKAFGSSSHHDVKDGMDMSLCTLDFDTMILKYAGANNNCVIIRDKEIIELKADKQPIGHFEHATPFNQQEIQLQKGDCIYQFTDGYIDQFGGEKGKKLKSRPFKNMLLEVSHLPLEEQYEKIKDFFENWIGSYEQIDDVCVFGVKV